MSDYHILRKSVDSRYAEVYVHLPIPATQTVAGVALSDATLTYQRALKESLESTVSVVPGISAGEQTDLDNGVLYEKHVNFRFDSLELTNAQRRTQIENGNGNQIGVIQMKADIATPDTESYNEIITPLEWWGYYRDV